MTITKITIQSLEDGMGELVVEDFHNFLYCLLAKANNEGIFCENGDIEIWRRKIFKELGRWKALRSKLDKKKLCDPKFWRRFKKTANRLRESMGEQDFASEKASWALCEPLFRQACELPLADSPTFPAKLCHFTFPALFPVSDQKMVKIRKTNIYPGYWMYARECWRHEDTNRRRLMRRLSRAIKENSGETPIDGYPFACKIAELHVIGKGGYPACLRG